MLPTTLLEPSASKSVRFAVEGRQGEDSDKSLVEGMIEGDERAWREFHERFDRLIFRCISRVTVRFASKVGADDVNEIHANLLFQLLANDKHKLRSFDAARGSRLASWVGLLATNATYDHLRSIKRHVHRSAPIEAERLVSGAPGPLEVFERRQRAEKVEGVLAELSERDRDFFEMYFADGLSPEEIAARMNISVKTVYSKKHKIRSKLEGLVRGAAAAA